MRILREYITVKVPSVFIEESSYKGVDEKTLLLNVTYNPEHHVRNFGVVTSVPDELTRFPLLSNHVSAPGYHDYPVWPWKGNDDIELDVCVGDRVYFHQNCLLPDNNETNLWNRMHVKSEKENGVMWHYFMIKYDLVFAAVRYEPCNRTTVTAFDWAIEAELKPGPVADVPEPVYCYTDKQGHDHIYRKKVVMIGSYVFVEPDMETWEEISIPLPEIVNGKKILNPDGKTFLMKPKQQWLVRKVMPEERYLCGWVRHCGSPLKGDREFLRSDMYIHFQPNTNTPVRFEGKRFFRMRQRHVIGIANYKPIKQNELV